MAPASRFAKGNYLLQSMPPNDRALLQDRLVTVDMHLRQNLERPLKRIDDVYFINSAVISIVAHCPDKDVEVGIAGCEGMSGSAVVFGADRSPHSTFVQVAGEGQRISAKDLRRCMDESPTLRACLLRYLHTFSVQTAHTAVANARANLQQRLARWLLMTHDRVPGNDIQITHEFLSLMLATRRAGVTEALQDFASTGLIETGRGHIAINDRRGLEQIAGHFYGKPEAEYRRLMN